MNLGNTTIESTINSLFSVSKKVVVVVGAAFGHGRAATKLLALAGAKVTAADSDTGALEELQKELQEAGARIAVRTVDVTDEQQISDLMSTAERITGQMIAVDGGYLVG